MRRHTVAKRHESRFDRIADIAGADDWEHDPWGTSMGLFFDVASVLDMSDVAGDVTDVVFRRWDYHRAPFAIPSIETVAARGDDFNEGEFADDYTYAQVSLAIAIRDGDLSQADLVYAGDVLARYTDLLKRSRRDY